MTSVIPRERCYPILRYPASLHSHSLFFLQVEALPLLAVGGVDGGARVADPDPGCSAFLPLDLGSGSMIEKILIWDPGINVPDHISESLVQYFGLKMFKFFVSSVLQIRIQNPMLFCPWIWDHGWKNPDLGINIPHPQ
jgi:hypothetical protein